ncbi:unnamed protein product, partial [Brachionus calyciflorus]
MRISVSETIFASGLENGEIKVWNYNSDTILNLYTLRSYTTGVLSLEYLSNNYLASGYSNGKIIIWNLLTKQTRIELTHSGLVRTILLIDLTSFASASSKTIKLWSIGNFSNILTKEHSISSDIISLKYYSKRLFSISSDGILKSWNNFVYEFEINVQCVVLSFELISNGNLACGCKNDVINIYSVGSTSFSFIRSFQQNRDVSSLVAIETQFLVSGDTLGTMNIWDHITGFKSVSFKGHTTNIYTLEYIGNRIFLSGSEAGFIKAWNVNTGKKLTEIDLNIPLRCLKYFDQKNREKKEYRITSNLGETTVLSETTCDKDLEIIITNDLKWNKQCVFASARANRALSQILFIQRNNYSALYCPCKAAHGICLKTIKDKPYEQRFKELSMNSLEDRRTRGDLI